MKNDIPMHRSSAILGALSLLVLAREVVAGAPVASSVDSVAVTVSDMDRALSFYKTILGFETASDDEIAGDDYEHLYGVFGARLRITALRTTSGPGVELLEYLAPRTGRAMPADTRANDLWSWHINLSADVNAADQAIRRGHFSYVSPGAITLIRGKPRSAVMVRDPDGHALLLQSP